MCDATVSANTFVGQVESPQTHKLVRFMFSKLVKINKIKKKKSRETTVQENTLAKKVYATVSIIES